MTIWINWRLFLMAVLAWTLITAAAPAQVARRQADVSVTAVNYPVTITFPTAPQPHDLLFLAVSTYSGATVAPSGSGWTLLLHQSANNWRQLVYWHAVAAGEANSYPVTNNNQTEMTMMDLEGTAFYSPIDAVVSAAPASSGTNYTMPAATGTVTGDLPIAVLSTDDVTGASVASPWTGAFSAQPHPLSLAIGPLTTDTTTAQSATFTLSAASTGGFGAATILVKPYNATPIAPVADSGSGYSGILPNTIAFDASASSDPKQETLAYAWTFGDGAAGAGVNPSHSYTAIGRYTATVTVTNTDCLSASASTVVVIQAGPSCITALGQNADISCFVLAPADLWHRDATNVPVDPMSSAILASVGANYMHPDGGTTADGYGIPYYVVDSSLPASASNPVPQPLVPWAHNGAWAEEYTYNADLTLYPFNLGMQLEDNVPDCNTGNYGDTHGILVDRATGKIYETDVTRRCPGNTPVWTATMGAVFDAIGSNWQRPWGFTSADAGGDSILKGLPRYDEIQAVLASAPCKADVNNCYLDHALRFQVLTPQCWDYINGGDGQGAWMLPAIHSACKGGSLKANPAQGGVIYGEWLRLDSTFDLSGFDAISAVIARTMMYRGLRMMDIGSNLYFTLTMDDRWNDDQLHVLSTIPKSALKVLQRTAIHAQDSYPSGPPPVIQSFTATPSTITAGQCTTLAWNITGASYAYIDTVGLLPATTGNRQFCPTATTTMNLVASGRNLANDDGNGARPLAFASVTVQQPAAPRPPFFWGR